MRPISVMLLLCVVILPRSTAGQTRGAAPVAGSGPHACALLTKELLTQVSPYDKKSLDMAFKFPATEDAVGRGGSECTYGGVTMNVDAFTPAAIERTLDKTWVPVKDVGEVAFFHDNGGRYAELYTRVGTHTMTIQMDVPNGRTAASIQSNVIALAKALLPKLK